jgi:hypothetical protein
VYELSTSENLDMYRTGIGIDMDYRGPNLIFLQSRTPTCRVVTILAARGEGA